MFVLFLFFMCTLFIKANGNTLRERTFRKISSNYSVDSNVVSLHGLVKTHSSSGVSCGHQCASADWCFSFAYDATTTSCSLYSEKIPLITSTSSSIYSDRCPASLSFKYKTSLNFCYMISTYAATWQAANDTCHNKGATLAKTNTTEYLNFLINFTSGHNVWVDGNDIATEGTFVWSDGNSLPNNSKVWDKDYSLPQPDGGNGIADEDCCIIINSGPKLHDEDCNSTLFFVCEYNL